MKQRKLIFTLLAASLPLLFLVLLEVGLRIFNAFPQEALFLEKRSGGRDIMEVNSQIGRRYFDQPGIPIPNMYPQQFSRHKASNTTRIFCLGGSTTGGFPYEMTVPFPKQLELILRSEQPQRRFEIINLGLSAINSFTVVDWIPEILDQDPDLILIYMGHNEYYGAYGTGSTISLGHQGWLIRSLLKLKHLHTIQMLNALASNIRESSSPDIDPTLMEKMIADRSISSDSELRQTTLTNYSDNLDLILSAFQRQNIPVILSNLVSNLKDQAPLDFTSRSTGEPTRAALDYQEGQEALKLNDSLRAYDKFSEAVDLDAVPFRASSKLNALIAAKAAEYELPLVDMVKVFREYSPQQIPGRELICDHLHPNPKGYRIMANAFYRTLVQHDLLPKDSGLDLSTTPRLVTALDWEIGSLRLYKLLHRWPFGDEDVNYADYRPLTDLVTAETAKRFLFQHSVWGKAHEEMAELYLQHGQPGRASQEYLAIIEMYPEKLEFYLKCIDCAKSSKDWGLLEWVGQRALPRSPAKGQLFVDLALAQRELGKTPLALTSIQEALKAPELNFEQSVRGYFLLAQLQVEMRNIPEARRVLEGLLDQAPDFIPASRLLEELSN